MKPNKGVSPTTGDRQWYKKVKQVLVAISQVILAAPIKLPAKVKAGAGYLAFILGIVESLEQTKEDQKEEEEDG